MQGTLPILFHLIFIIIPMKQYCYYPLFMDEKTES